MIYLRSAVYNVVFYLNMIVLMLLALPTLLMRRQALLWWVKAWGATSLWWLKVICGTRVEFLGLERIPEGGFLIASKHQSTWETFALFQIFEDPTYVLKRELQWIPFFGWYTIKFGTIPVNRTGGAAVLQEMNRRAAEEARKGRQIIIFPEGTRRPAGAPPSYKFGIAHMYSQMNVPCVPIALNSGLFWPRRKFLRYPGTIVVEVLEPIPPGLPREVFFAQLQERIETASDRLLRAGGGRSPAA